MSRKKKTRCKIKYTKYEKGDLITEDEPYATILFHEYNRKNCDFCLNKGFQLKECKGCKSLFYCSTMCQFRDYYRSHKYGECEVLAVASSKLFTRKKFSYNLLTCNLPRLVLRIYCMYVSGTLNYLRHTELSKYFEELWDYREKIVKDRDKMRTFQQIKIMFNNARVNYDEEKLFKIYCKTFFNSVYVTDSNMNQVGIGCYSIIIQYNHSTVPNCHMVFRGRTLYLIAKKYISLIEEKLMINYHYVKDDIDKDYEKIARNFYYGGESDCQMYNKHIFDEGGQVFDWQRRSFIPLSYFQLKALIRFNELKADFYAAISRGDREFVIAYGHHMLRLARICFHGKNNPEYITILVRTIESEIFLRKFTANQNIIEKLKNKVIQVFSKKTPLYTIWFQFVKYLYERKYQSVKQC